MPNGTYGGVRGGLNSTYSIYNAKYANLTWQKPCFLEDNDAETSERLLGGSKVICARIILSV